MHHTFFYRERRVEVRVHLQGGSWVGRYSISDDLEAGAHGPSARSLAVALHDACAAARLAIERKCAISQAVMDKPLSIRVEQSSSKRKYVWVISEIDGDFSTVELAASLDSYDRPSDAMRAGEQVLRTLQPSPP